MRKLLIIPFAVIAIIGCYLVNCLFVGNGETNENRLPKTMDAISKMNINESFSKDELPVLPPQNVAPVETNNDSVKLLKGLLQNNEMMSAASYAAFMDSNINLDNVSIDIQTDVISKMIRTYQYEKDKVTVISGTGKGLKGTTAELDELVKMKYHKTAFLAIRLRDGASIGYNVDDFNSSCSTIKVPMTLYAAKLIASGDLSYTDVFTYTKDTYISGSGSIKNMSYGTRFKLKTLIKLAIDESDNIAHQMLCKYIGVNNMYDYIQNIGGKVLSEDKANKRYWADSTARSAALWWNQVYLFKDSGEVGNWYWKLLGDAPSRYENALKGNKECYMKTGSSTSYMHEAGIVMGDEPYLVVLFTKSSTGIQSYFNKMVRAIDKLICS